MFFSRVKGGAPAVPLIISPLESAGSIFIAEAREGEPETALLLVLVFSLP